MDTKLIKDIIESNKKCCDSDNNSCNCEFKQGESGCNNELRYNKKLIINNSGVEYSDINYFSIDELNREVDNNSINIDKQYVRSSYLSKDDFCSLAEVIRIVNKIDVKEKIDSKAVVRFAFGTIMHDMVRLMFRDKIYNVGYFCKSCGKFVVGENYKLYTKCDNCGSSDLMPFEKHFIKDHISGHLDGAIKINDEFGVFELKSCNTNVFKMLDRPLKSHVIQMNLYMYLTNFSYGVIMYIDRERMVDWEVKQYKVYRSDDLINKYLGIVRDMFDDISNNKIDKSIKNARCGEIRDKNCQFRHICRKFF